MDILHIWATDVIFLYKIVHAFKKPAVLFEGFNLDVGHSLCLSQWAGDYVRDCLSGMNRWSWVMLL